MLTIRRRESKLKTAECCRVLGFDTWKQLKKNGGLDKKEKNCTKVGRQTGDTLANIMWLLSAASIKGTFIQD